jgi:hypothetical protein
MIAIMTLIAAVLAPSVQTPPPNCWTDTNGCALRVSRKSR